MKKGAEMGESMKCGRCEEVLIREETEDQEFLELGLSFYGTPLCFVCFEEMTCPACGSLVVRSRLHAVPGGRKATDYPMEEEQTGDFENDSRDREFPGTETLWKKRRIEE